MPVSGGASIGHKCICTFPTIRTGKLVLQILKKNGDAEIRNMKAYYEKV